MASSSAPVRLDIAAFANAGRDFSGDDPIAAFPRVAAQAGGTLDAYRVQWQASGEVRDAVSNTRQIWLHLNVQAAVPMTCQRCLEPVDVALDIDRWFRFVANEEAAAAEDDDVEEDLLVLAPDFDLAELIEDEMVLELPAVARHEDCALPGGRTGKANPQSTDTAAPERQKPFAVLAGIKVRRDDGGGA